MILKQYYLGCLSHASYLIGDPEAGTAAVVDPQRDVGHYLAEAGARGLSIDRVFLTHFHADFLAGHLELRERAGAEIHLGSRAEAEYAFTPVDDGEVVPLGALRLRVLHTPGHTPEGISIVIHESEGSPPHAVLTGDTLFIGDVGRPDLMVASGMSAEDLAGMLYDSLHEKLLRLPDDVLLYPAHGAGSACGKNLSSETVARLGDQRRMNPMLRPMTKKEFVDTLTADQPAAPAYFSYDARMNTRERPTLDETLARVLRPLTVETAVRMANSGAVLLDTRDPDDFADGHIAGSVNIGLRGNYASWAGALLDPTTPLVILGEPGTEEEAAMRLGRIGFDNVAGYVEGGMTRAHDHEDLLRCTGRVDASGLAAAMAGEARPVVLDIRTPGEWSAGHIEGSIHLPLLQLMQRLDELPADREFVVACRSGYRSSIGASLLRTRGFPARDLRGGLLAWDSHRIQAEP